MVDLAGGMGYRQASPPFPSRRLHGTQPMVSGGSSRAVRPVASWLVRSRSPRDVGSMQFPALCGFAGLACPTFGRVSRHGRHGAHPDLDNLGRSPPYPPRTADTSFCSRDRGVLIPRI